MKFVKTFFHQQIVDYRARARAGAGAGAGAGAAILTSWSQSRAKMERLHNTAGTSNIFFSFTVLGSDPEPYSV